MSKPRAIVAGGGPVGLAFACAARGFDVQVLEGSAPAAEPERGAPFDLRVFAVSPGTRDLLRTLGAWERLDPRRVAPVRRMLVRGDAGAQLSFSAPARGALAWIVEAPRLAAALAARATELGVEILQGARARSFGAEAGAAWAVLEDGRRLEGDLLVGADGPESAVRSALGIAVEARRYAESAIVANFDTEGDPEGVARQWFRADGVLAWLPLPGRRISIVWSAPDAIAEELMALKGEALCERVREAGGGELGQLQLASQVARFPLSLREVVQPVVPGAALIGDAAHTVHPLAGQGVNLGMRDARLLAEVLAARSPLERAGDLRLLRRYARGRREDVSAMQWLTDGLDRLFSTPDPAAARLRNAGLALVERQDWAKRALVARAMR